MRHVLFILLIAFVNPLFAQHYWQQQTDYNIRVTFNDTLKSITGNLELKYTNNSPDTLHFIWFHLWPNAYKNDRTAFSEQLLQDGNTRFYFSDESDKGYINQLQFAVDETFAETRDHPEHQDIIQLILPQALPPGNTITISTPFHVQLPKYFSRSGYNNNLFRFTQWYPKPAVYDSKGWHPMPYLDMGEFYSEFGRFRVTVTVPSGYEVAATGNLIEKVSDANQTTSVFEENNIHDFAWFASKHFEHQKDSVYINDNLVTLNLFYNSNNSERWSGALPVMKDAVVKMSEWVGDYPYRSLSVVEDPFSGSGGMEYPTITLVTGFEDSSTLFDIVRHEIIHNWFYGILASNERRYPWMDEGMTSYFDHRFAGTSAILPNKTGKGLFAHLYAERMEKTALTGLYNLKADQPLSTSSEDLTNYNYVMIPYEKGAAWMQHLEATMGNEKFDRLMKAYFQKWKFRHPYPEDFKHLADSIYGADLNEVFALLNKRGPVTKQKSRPFNIKLLSGLSDHQRPNSMYVFPVVGYNKYDKIMPGLIIHNYGLPLSRFRYLAIPMYGAGSGKPVGLARLSYHHYGTKGNQLAVSLAGSRFHKDAYTDKNGSRTEMDFLKIVPALRYTFAKAHPRATTHRYVQYNYFHIRETDIHFERDTVNSVFYPTYPKHTRYVQQLKLVMENNRKLYPYQLSLMGEHGEGFVKTHLTAEYFFNYPKGGGLKVRAFGGKFFYTGTRTAATAFNLSRYHYNMSGASGFEDYTYSDYFIGRNEFDGFASQQMKIRDGGFKVRTDLLADKVGRSDDWLAAINFSTTIPRQLNPLSVLPVKIPLKVFADLGTSADGWDNKNGGERFLYDAGLQLTLLSTVNVYFPILYSKVYRDYFKSTISEKRYLKTISFSINLNGFPIRQQLPQLAW